MHPRATQIHLSPAHLPHPKFLPLGPFPSPPPCDLHIMSVGSSEGPPQSSMHWEPFARGLAICSFCCSQLGLYFYVRPAAQALLA